MTTAPIKCLLLFVIMMVIMHVARSQQFRANAPNSTLLYPKQYGTFENYVFILNGGIIEKQELLNYPEARLGRVFNYTSSIKRMYEGVVYFHTPWYPPSPPDEYANDPAYFINSIQVSPYIVRSSLTEQYTSIKRSEQDTLIDGIVYKGSIHIDTEEDFFAHRMTISEIVKKYTGLPIKDVIVHWRNDFCNIQNPGLIIQDHFPLYYFDLKGLQEVKVDRIPFAGGERYFIHLVDEGYPYDHFPEKSFRSTLKSDMIFDYPMDFDPEAPCYEEKFNSAIYDIHHRAKSESKPFGGEEDYIKKLANNMGLQTIKPPAKTTQDSILVQFIVLWKGGITDLESLSPQKPAHTKILQAIKHYSCVWSGAEENGTLLLFRRKMAIFYSKDKEENIRSLDRLEYRYDDHQPNITN